MNDKVILNQTRVNCMAAGTLAVLSLLFAPPINATADWITFQCEDGSFSVSLPTQPNHTSSELQEQKLGTITNHLYRTASDDGLVLYCVGYNKYPSDVPKDEDKKWVIDGGRDAAVAKVDGKLGNQEEIRLSGNPGIAFGFSFTVDGSHVKAFARIYFANASLYRLLVYVADGKDHADDVKRFFDSFVLLGNQG